MRVNSDYGQLSGEMWEFLNTIYGGGPELVIKQVVQSPTLKSMAEQAQPPGSVRTDRPASAQPPENTESPTKSENEVEQVRNED